MPGVQLIATALLVAFLWALQTVINKYAMTKAMSYQTVVFISAVTIAASTAAFAWRHRDVIGAEMVEIPVECVWLVAFGAFVGSFLATRIATELLAEHNSSVVAALTYTTPMFVFLLASIVLREKLDLGKLYGIFITIVGIVITSVGLGAPPPV